MRVVDIVRGVVAGYGVKIIQILATLLVVPFLLRDDVLGLDDYGRIFAILGLLSPASLLTDGLRSSFSRTVARSLAEDDVSTGREIGSAVKLIAAVSAAIIAVLLPTRDGLLKLIGVPVEADYQIGIAWAIVYISIENLVFIVMTHLNSRGRMDVVNGVVAVETIARNLAFVAWFTIDGGSVRDYFAIFVIAAAIKSLVLLAYSLRRWPQDFHGFWSGRIAETGEAVRYSFSLSAISINFFVFQRLSIPLTARFIGPAEAGLLSLGINTIANNLSQVLFNVARPILIPVASRIRFDRLSASRASLLLNVDAIYSITVGLVTVPIIASLPTLIGVWLGGEHDELVLPAQILVAGAALNVAFNVRRALMVGQGLAGPLARASLLCGAIGLVGLYWALIVQPSWPAIAGVVAVVGGTSSAIGAGIAFDRAALLPGTRSAQRGLRTIGVLLVSIAAAFAASRFAPTGLDPTMVFPPIVGAATILLMGHVALIPLATVFDTLKRLRAGAERPLFEDAAGPDS